MKNILIKIINFVLNKKSTDSWHEDFIVHLGKILRPNIYVELWLYKCQLFNRMIPYSNKLIWVDLSSESWKFMKKSKKTSFINMMTDDYYDIIKNSWIKIDMLFIDANHSKESVKKDFENYFNLVSDNWIILLHDWFPKNKEYTKSWYCWDWYIAIEELTKNKNSYEMMTIPLPPWLTLCRKRNKHLPW